MSYKTKLRCSSDVPMYSWVLFKPDAYFLVGSSVLAFDSHLSQLVFPCGWLLSQSPSNWQMFWFNPALRLSAVLHATFRLGLSRGLNCSDSVESHFFSRTNLTVRSDSTPRD